MARFAHITRPKCGSQWVRDVLCDPLVLPAGYRQHEPAAADHYGMQSFANEPDGTLVSPLFDIFPDEWAAVRRQDDRCVVVLRDPRDMIVSSTFSMAYSHVSSPAVDLTRTSLLALDLRGKLEVGVGAFIATSRLNVAWVERAPTPGELVCRFEDLLTDEAGVFRSMFDHFGWDVDDETLRTITARYTFRRKTGGRGPGEKDAYSHFRNAVTGDWRNYFDRDLARRFESVRPGLLRRLGYEMRDDWWNGVPEVLPELSSEPVAARYADAPRAEDAVRLAAEQLLRRLAELDTPKR